MASAADEYYFLIGFLDRVLLALLRYQGPYLDWGVAAGQQPRTGTLSVKIFVSSAIRGLEVYRDAAARAAAVLRHEVKRAEDFPASPSTAQQACLAGVRWADAVLLLIGPRYGPRQPSGLSATRGVPGGAGALPCPRVRAA